MDARIGNGLERLKALGGGNQPEWESMFIQVARQTSYRAMFQQSSGPLLGADTSKPKRGCLGVSKGTGEARLIRVITQPDRHLSVQVSPMRQTGGGAVVVVRGWESQPQRGSAGRVVLDNGRVH